jgi:hypothetical protein
MPKSERPSYAIISMREECNMSHYPNKEYPNAILRLARQGMQQTKPTKPSHIERKILKKGERQ